MARNQETYQYYRAESWKGKAIFRGKECKVYKQLVGELRDSRDKLRGRYESCMSQLREAENRVFQLEQVLKKNG